MAGTAKKMIDQIIRDKAKGDKVIENALRVKLILKGIPVDKLTYASPDDPTLIQKIQMLSI